MKNRFNLEGFGGSPRKGAGYGKPEHGLRKPTIGFKPTQG